jgi:hypothetical protein
MIRAERDGRAVCSLADMAAFSGLLAYLRKECRNELCKTVTSAAVCNC